MSTQAANSSVKAIQGDIQGVSYTGVLSPDRAARLAQAAWGVASAGAEVTDRILMMLRETLEKRA